MGKLLMLLFLVHQSSAVIYHLNFTEYGRMPEMFEMDDYDACIAEPGAIYCLLDAVLFSRDGSDLMRMIQEYSEHKIKHFNHTVVHRAFCIQRTCMKFTQNRSLENEVDLRTVLEECVDDSMWTGYNLNARLTNIQYCKKHDQERKYGTGDYIVIGIYFALIILNVTGTSYDILKGDVAGNPYLLAFSLRRNWQKLIAPNDAKSDSRLNRLQVFNGLRSITMIMVIFSHVPLVFIFSYIKNPYYLESTYDDPTKYLLYNGVLVVYTFFVMSGFLLAFNLEIHSEKNRVSLWDWPKGMLMRWLRITPTYALIMFTIMTINRHFGDGPLWDFLVTSEANACNHYWWTHLLYINNYFYGNRCYPQTWYLAADMQLFALGLLLCVLCRTLKTQVAALIVMLGASLAIAVTEVYYQGLGALFLQTPENIHSLFGSDDTYRLSYVRGHSHLSTYALGIAGGQLAYHWLSNVKGISERLQKHAWLMWLSLPLMLVHIMSGVIFYIDDYVPSSSVTALYAAVYKPIFQLYVVIIIIGCIFKVENVYRSILEWRGFTWVARASYGAFLVHPIFLRSLIGTQRGPGYMSDLNVASVMASTILLTMPTGAALFVAVETPLAVVTKTMFVRRRKQQKSTEDDIKT